MTLRDREQGESKGEECMNGSCVGFGRRGSETLLSRDEDETGSNRR